MFQGFSELHSGFTAPSAHTGQSFDPFNEDFYGPSPFMLFALAVGKRCLLIFSFEGTNEETRG
jgi:hypothetical protein